MSLIYYYYYYDVYVQKKYLQLVIKGNNFLLQKQSTLYSYRNLIYSAPISIRDY